MSRLGTSKVLVIILQDVIWVCSPLISNQNVDFGTQKAFRTKKPSNEKWKQSKWNKGLIDPLLPTVLQLLHYFKNIICKIHFMGLWPACILNAGSSFEKYSDKWQRGGGVILIPTFPYSSPTIPQFFFRTEMVMVLNWTNVTQIGTISSISRTYFITYACIRELRCTKVWLIKCS